MDSSDLEFFEELGLTLERVNSRLDREATQSSDLGRDMKALHQSVETLTQLVTTQQDARLSGIREEPVSEAMARLTGLIAREIPDHLSRQSRDLTETITREHKTLKQTLWDEIDRLENRKTVSKTRYLPYPAITFGFWGGILLMALVDRGVAHFALGSIFDFWWTDPLTMALAWVSGAS